MSLRHIALLWISLLLAINTTAQGAFAPYTWQATQLTLQVPRTWQTHEVGETLIIAQAFANDPNRPQAIPFVQVSLLSPNPEAPLTEDEALTQALVQIGIPDPRTFALQETRFASSTSPDGTLYALGQVQRLPDGRIALLVGRGANASRATIEAAFYPILESLATSNVLAPYRPIWQTDLMFSPNSALLFDFTALRTAQNGNLYALERQQGVMVLDAQTGTPHTFYPFPQNEPAQAFALAITPEGIPLVLDSACMCLKAWRDGRWITRQDFTSATLPAHMATSPDGTLFLSGVQIADAPLAYVERVATDSTTTTIYFETPQAVPALLAMDSFGTLFALTRNPFTLLKLEEDSYFSEVVTLELPAQANVIDFAITPDTQIAVALPEGVLLFGVDGRATHPIAQGAGITTFSLTAGADGTLYSAGVGNRGGIVRALGLGVAEGRIGRTSLIPARLAQGNLDRSHPTQYWTFTGQAREAISLAVSGTNENPSLLMQLRLFAPNGEELRLVTNDTAGVLANPNNPYLRQYTLPATGDYTVFVERVEGFGDYQIGYSRSQSLIAGETAWGTFANALPEHHYTFEGRSGQAVTLTLTTTSPLVTPLLMLYNARGELIAQSETLELTSDGQAATLTAFRLPSNGQYTVVAGRAGDSASYRLTLTAP